jgi:hypothetical protein
MKYFDMRFPEHWVGRDRPIPWPLPSPDITLVEFFLWGHVKYKTLVTSLELTLRIAATIERVTLQMLENTWKEIEYRLDTFRVTKGAHIEVV